MSSYFFQQVAENDSNNELLKALRHYSELHKKQIFAIQSPLGESKYEYGYKDYLVILAAKHRIIIWDYGNSEDEFKLLIEDVLEDLASMSDKFEYKRIIGRPRNWKHLIEAIQFDDQVDVEELFELNSLEDPIDVKKTDLLISLFTGSINDVNRVKEEVPETVLDKVKQKIQLFDANQTDFVYGRKNQKVVSIQGLSGTGKTELLLHKLKDIYVESNSSKVYFTCHNRILAHSLRKRIPDFFNFMKVEQQIEWNSRLWCTNAWGSEFKPNSGLYSYVCNFYHIPFHRYSYSTSFEDACLEAFEKIKLAYKDKPMSYAFDYIIIDESQDFGESFFKLCELITEKQVYVAGDVFQSIFDDVISNKIEPDFLLGKCYRTDPRTLMFAHALGMGLFENPKLRWLDEQEWKDCGYSIKIDENRNFSLSREPVRRFEDIAQNYDSIELCTYDNFYAKSEDVINIVQRILQENETAQPEDIGIINLDYSRRAYSLADSLEVDVPRLIGWQVNKAYETKVKKSDTLMVSNRNNVKGLEFPFVICITSHLKGSHAYRNALYTMLSRSFIKTYFLTARHDDAGITKDMLSGLQLIMKEGLMVVNEPSPEEQETIKTTFDIQRKKVSNYELIKQILNEQGANKATQKTIISSAYDIGIFDKEQNEIEQFVKDMMKYYSNK
jgi:superfamily I DNA and RNA helicase